MYYCLHCMHWSIYIHLILSYNDIALNIYTENCIPLVVSATCKTNNNKLH